MSTSTRDDFSADAKRVLANRVGQRCSNPECRALTTGPQIEPTKAVNIGVAAHITAASAGGPRFDSRLSPGERAGVENGIWLCQNCAKRVDNDPRQYTCEVLLTWRKDAELDAHTNLGRTRTSTSVASNDEFELVATQAEEANLDDESEHKQIWQMFHLARISQHDGSELGEIAGALSAVRLGASGLRYWQSGSPVSIGSVWYYPTGKHACVGSTWYYPNGKHACIGSVWYYPTGKHACIGSTWYHPSGSHAGTEASMLARAVGGLTKQERDAVGAGLRRLSGDMRTLALVDLVCRGGN